jgi:hypothetical protein
VGIRWWSPTQLLIHRFKACVWQSGRDAQFSLIYGRMCLLILNAMLYRIVRLVCVSLLEVKGVQRVEGRTNRGAYWAEEVGLTEIGF